MSLTYIWTLRSCDQDGVLKAHDPSMPALASRRYFRRLLRKDAQVVHCTPSGAQFGAQPGPPTEAVMAAFRRGGVPA